MDIASASAAITRWLLSVETRKRPFVQSLQPLGDLFVAHGVPVHRMRTGVITKHPEVLVRTIGWSPGEAPKVDEYQHSVLERPTFLENPVKQIRYGTDVVRCHLRGPNADLSYEICRELAGEGYTDYVIYCLEFSCGERSYFSFATKSDEQFSDTDLQLFSTVIPALTAAIEIESKEYALRSLLNVYLGPNAATRVLQGAFLRGTGETIEAAVWFCDMRDFSAFADATPAGRVVAVLDRFFEAVANPVVANGGEVLKFIGDAVLAIFPIGEAGRVDACRRAFAAAKAARDNVDAQSGAGSLPNVTLGISLHVGQVMYGNIGTQDRLDFTAIGTVINEVCRVQSLCRVVGPILLTKDFAAEFGTEVTSAGFHQLKGIAKPKELFIPV